MTGNLTVDAGDTLTGTGGTASLLVGAGAMTVSGDALVNAEGSWANATTTMARSPRKLAPRRFPWPASWASAAA